MVSKLLKRKSQKLHVRGFIVCSECHREFRGENGFRWHNDRWHKGRAKRQYRS